ncbi:three component ABC system middle component [Brevibacillus nitrificans]|uniref:three component ABC system middle component n=1 Tax=Brevibacillus nitrificans TaxID=651560 RepID=UPI00285B027E|nr:three component ABC system middle component [Brevibacillus nitrificans]MDR7319699.1 hypothetical protein [Brevibacillus nitrificans]
MESSRIINADHIQNLSINPFFGSQLIQHFLSGYGEKFVPTVLVYLVMPMIYYRPSRNLLVTAKKNSTLFTLFKDDSEKVVALGGLQERVLFFENVTNQGIIVAFNERSINITTEGIQLLRKASYKDIEYTDVKTFFRAAYYLGKLVSKMDTVNVFRLLGVTNV